jgi:ATP phosphoribosyltransferase
MPDRIETGTYPVRRRGHRRRRAPDGHVVAGYLDAVIDKLMDAGCEIVAERDAIRLVAPPRLKAVSIRTAPYPAFPTDMQAQFMAINCGRRRHRNDARDDFRKPLHARRGTGPPGRRHQDRRQHGRVTGVPKLDGATVMATDLRASASLVIAGLVAQGETLIERIYHLDRGYDRHGTKLAALGADIRRVKSSRMSGIITIALSKGRIFEETLPLLAAAGIVPAEDPEKSRKLIIGTNRADVRVVIVRATDVPTYVQYGAADLGIAGKDVLLEHGGAGLYQPLDLNIAKCRMSVAVRPGFDYAAAVRRGARLRVATKYIRRRPRAFRRQGRARRPDQALRLDGTGAAGGLADAIVDLVSSGGTLKANNLVEVEEIMDISSSRWWSTRPRSS